MHVFTIRLKENQRNLGLARIFAKEPAFVHGENKGIDAVMASIFGKLNVLIDAAKEPGELPADIDTALLAHNLAALYYTFMPLAWQRRADSGQTATAAAPDTRDASAMRSNLTLFSLHRMRISVVELRRTPA